MAKSDLVSGLFFIGLSLFVCQQSGVIGLGTLRKPGPGLIIFGAASGIGVLALALVVKSFILKADQINFGNDERSISRGKFLSISASLFVYAIIVKWLGFAPSTFLFVFFVLHTIESQRWWRILVKAVLITIANYLAFVVWLGISLPKGLLAW